ncbi:hypothetical protein GCM10020000_37840 [Streptomyces olivoverticillatus]
MTVAGRVVVDEVGAVRAGGPAKDGVEPSLDEAEVGEVAVGECFPQPARGVAGAVGRGDAGRCEPHISGHEDVRLRGATVHLVHRGGDRGPHVDDALQDFVVAVAPIVVAAGGALRVGQAEGGAVLQDVDDSGVVGADGESDESGVRGKSGQLVGQLRGRGAATGDVGEGSGVDVASEQVGVVVVRAQALQARLVRDSGGGGGRVPPMAT